jgi:hypothetical protein
VEPTAFDKRKTHADLPPYGSVLRCWACGRARFRGARVKHEQANLVYVDGPTYYGDGVFVAGAHLKVTCLRCGFMWFEACVEAPGKPAEPENVMFTGTQEEALPKSEFLRRATGTRADRWLIRLSFLVALWWFFVGAVVVGILQRLGAIQ